MIGNTVSVGQRGRAIEQFDPERYRLKVAAIDYGINEAKRIRDWPALEDAVESKIEEQHKFVAWWDANVRHKGQPIKELAGTAANSLSSEKATELTGMKHQRVSDLRASLEKLDLYRRTLLGPVYRRAHLKEGDARTLLNQGEVEWYTPVLYIEMARKVLGEIDLDPASGEIAQKVVKAKKWYSRDDSGLTHEWHGRVWMNPPYSNPLIKQMMAKLCAEFRAGRVSAAVVLVNNCTEVGWFQEAGALAAAICFPKRRIKFLDPEGREGGALQGQTFFYFGDAADTFVEVFSEIGLVVSAWSHDE